VTAFRALLNALPVVLVFTGCTLNDGDESERRPAPNPPVANTVRADGSSTVAPFAKHAAELFRRENPEVRITVAVSGTRGGFKRFCGGEIDIWNASRPIAEEEEFVCVATGLDFFGFPIANDAVTLITSRRNHWARCLTTRQIRRIWRPGSRVRRWNEIDRRFPNEKLQLFGPDAESGTFEFFTEAINRSRGESRSDYTSSEDDNDTVRAVRQSSGGLGYVGYTYYAANQDSLRAIAVDGGGGCARPSVETVQKGTYDPLSRRLYLYVNAGSLQRTAVKEFVGFMLTDVDAPLLASLARLIPLTAREAAQTERAFRRAVSEEPPAPS
jgi:phosphate transport system substrate-binding protein